MIISIAAVRNVGSEIDRLVFEIYCYVILGGRNKFEPKVVIHGNLIWSIGNILRDPKSGRVLKIVKLRRLKIAKMFLFKIQYSFLLLNPCKITFVSTALLIYFVVCLDLSFTTSGLSVFT